MLLIPRRGYHTPSELLCPPPATTSPIQSSPAASSSLAFPRNSTVAYTSQVQSIPPVASTGLRHTPTTLAREAPAEYGPPTSPLILCSSHHGPVFVGSVLHSRSAPSRYRPGTSPKHHFPQPRPGCLPGCSRAALSPGGGTAPLRSGARGMFAEWLTRLGPAGSDSSGHSPEEDWVGVRPLSKPLAGGPKSAGHSGVPPGSWQPLARRVPPSGTQVRPREGSLGSDTRVPDP